MRFGYGLSRLLGSVYGNGSVVFLPPEGTCVLSPVRNRVVRICSIQLESKTFAPHYVLKSVIKRGHRNFICSTALYSSLLLFENPLDC